MFSLPFSMICSIALRYRIWKALRVSMISDISLISFPTSTSAWKSMSIDSFVLLCIATCYIDSASSSLIKRSSYMHFYPLRSQSPRISPTVPTENSPISSIDLSIWRGFPQQLETNFGREVLSSLQLRWKQCSPKHCCLVYTYI